MFSLSTTLDISLAQRSWQSLANSISTLASRPAVRPFPNAELQTAVIHGERDKDWEITNYHCLGMPIGCTATAPQFHI